MDGDGIPDLTRNCRSYVDCLLLGGGGGLNYPNINVAKSLEPHRFVHFTALLYELYI